MKLVNPFRWGFGVAMGAMLAILLLAALAIFAVGAGMAWGGIPGVLAFLVVLLVFGMWGGIAVTLAFAVLLGQLQHL
jgi:hypothetical protein